MVIFYPDLPLIAVESTPDERLGKIIVRMCQSAGIVEREQVGKIRQDVLDSVYSMSAEGITRLCNSLTPIVERAERNIGEM